MRKRMLGAATGIACGLGMFAQAALAAPVSSGASPTPAALAAAGGAALAAAGGAALAAGGGLTNPTGNLTPPADGPGSGQQAALAAIDSAQAGEGLPPLQLPANYASLPAGQQLFVLIDEERITRGLPPATGLATVLDQAAAAGAAQQQDPAFPGTLALTNAASVWGEAPTLADVVFGWMYDDGWGGSAAATPNLDCTGPGAPGCWGHRDAILGDYGASPLAGAAVTSLPNGEASAAAELAGVGSGTQPALDATWAQVSGATGGGGGSNPPANTPPANTPPAPSPAPSPIPNPVPNPIVPTPPIPQTPPVPGGPAGNGSPGSGPGGGGVTCSWTPLCAGAPGGATPSGSHHARRYPRFGSGGGWVDGAPGGLSGGGAAGGRGSGGYAGGLGGLIGGR